MLLNSFPPSLGWAPDSFFRERLVSPFSWLLLSICLQSLCYHCCDQLVGPNIFFSPQLRMTRLGPVLEISPFCRSSFLLRRDPNVAACALLLYGMRLLFLFISYFLYSKCNHFSLLPFWATELTSVDWNTCAALQISWYFPTLATWHSNCLTWFIHIHLKISLEQSIYVKYYVFYEHPWKIGFHAGDFQMVH